MPKVNSKQAPVPAPQARQSKLVVFVDADNTKRVLVPVPKTYKVRSWNHVNDTTVTAQSLNKFQICCSSGCPRVGPSPFPVDSV